MEQAIDAAGEDALRAALRRMIAQADVVYGQLAMVIHQDTADRIKETDLREIERILGEA